MHKHISGTVIQYTCLHMIYLCDVEKSSQLTMYHRHFYCICQSFKHGELIHSDSPEIQQFALQNRDNPQRKVLCQSSFFRGKL